MRENRGTQQEAAGPAPVGNLPVRVVRSGKRKKTVSANVVGGAIVVRAPRWMTNAELAPVIEQLRGRLFRSHGHAHYPAANDLARVFARLNGRYFDGKLAAPRLIWCNAARQFGAYHVKTNTIRISHRMAAMPRWVFDYVMVHEMAHLLVLRHNEAFWKIVNRYPLAERARGYLLAADAHRGAPEGVAEGKKEEPLPLFSR